MAAPADVRNWYVIRDRKKVGPLPESELLALAAAGQLQPTDMVLCEGHTRWMEAASVVGLFSTPTAPNGSAAPLAIPVAAFSASAPLGTLAPAPLPSATMLSERHDDSPKRIPVPPPIQLPGYDIEEELGRGGMGVVYKARQQKASRVVALKMILSGAHAGTEDLARFQTEAEAVARLQHPHIIQVHEVGEHEGRPYFSLEYCGGGTLDRKLRDNPLLPRDAAQLVEVLARAMHHAHTHHILHRDLKPANVLLTEDGVPKITDFGLAKKLDETGQTASGAVMGTPSYMSPEQASGKARHLTASTDVYALGAILYDCLAGRPPFRAATALDTILQVITDAPVPPAHLNPKVPADLQTICLKCLEKNPTHRYATAEELAEDLRRFTSGEPIHARPAGLVERGWKWAKRRPAAASLLAVTLFAALSLFVGGIYFTGRLRSERNDAVEQRQRAERSETETKEQKQAVEQERERAEQQKHAAEERKGEAERRLEEARRSLFTSQVWRAAGVWDRNPLHGRYLLLDPTVCPTEFRDFAWGYYLRLCSWEATALRHPGAVHSVAVSPDGTTLATACGDGTVILWDLENVRQRSVLKGHKGAVHGVAFSTAGLLASGGADKDIRLWDPSAGTHLDTLSGHVRDIQDVAFTADGKQLVSAAGWYPPNWKGNIHQNFRDGEVRLWDVATRKQVGPPLFKSDAAVYCLAVSPVARLAAAGLSHGSTTRLLDLDTGKEIATLSSGSGWNQGVAFSPDGQTLAIGTANHQVHLWDVARKSKRTALSGHQNQLEAVAFTPDGKGLASGCTAGTVKVWDLVTSQERVSLPSRYGSVRSLAFTPDGQRLIAAHLGGLAVVWGVRRKTVEKTFGGGVTDLSLRADGTVLLYAGVDGKVRLRDWASDKEPTLLDLTKGQAATVAQSRDGSTLAIGVNHLVDGIDPVGVEIQVKSAAGQLLASFPTKEPIRTVVLTPDGSKLFALTFPPQPLSTATAGSPFRLLGWSLESKQRLPLPAALEAASGVAVSPNGETLAVATGATIRLLDCPSWNERTQLNGHADIVYRLAFSVDGKLLASCGNQGQVRLWDALTGRERKTRPISEAALCVAFTPDGRTLALGCADRSVRLIDVETGQVRAVLTGHTREVTGVAFTPDGQKLISGSGPFHRESWARGGEIRVWQAAPYR